MKNRYTLLLILSWLFSAGMLYSQKQGQELIDSLQMELGYTKEDTVKVNILNQLSRQFFLIANYNTALSLGDQSLELAKQIQFKRGTAIAYKNIANVFENLTNYPEALKNHQEELKIRKEIGNKLNIAKTYSDIGHIYFNQGNLPQSLKNRLVALGILEEIGDKVKIAYMHTKIGAIYDINGNRQDALKYYSIAVEFFKEIVKEGTAESSMFLNIGNYYSTTGNFLDAIKYFTEGLIIAENIGDKHMTSAFYNNMGNIYKAQGNYNEALKSYNASLKINEEFNAKSDIAVTYDNIGQVYLLMNEPKVAKKWLQKGLQLCIENGETEPIRNAYENLATVDSALDDYKSAYKHYKLYTLYKDSLINKENTRELTRLEMNYEFKKQQDSIHFIKDAEIAIRDATLEANRRQRWFFIGGLLALAVIGGLLYNQSKQRKKNNEKLQQLNEELDNANKIKTRFFSILNHDLRSPVSNLIHYLHLKKENPELLDEETKQRLDQKSIQGAENLLITMEDLLLWSKGQMENFKPQPRNVAVHQLFEDTKKVFSGYQNIRFEYHNSDNLEIFTDENYLKTIIRNLTSNAINVFTSTHNPHIVWKAYEEKEKPVLAITDNGPGADNEKFRALYDETEVIGIKTGLGLHLIRDLAKAIDCKIEVESEKEKGTTFTLKFNE